MVTKTLTPPIGAKPATAVVRQQPMRQPCGHWRTKLKIARTITLLLHTAISVASLASAAPAFASESVNLPVTELKFFETGVGPLQAAPAYGDLSKGAHGTFIKMPAGFVSPVHTHTADYYAVVIDGVGANGAPGSVDVPLPSGSYWLQKGGEPHVTKCISATECIFFLVQPEKFDYVTR